MEILFTVLMFFPLVAVLWLVNLSWRKRIEGEIQSERLLKFLGYGLLALLFVGLILIGLFLQAAGLLANLDPQVAASALPPGFSADVLPRMALGFWVPSLFGLLMLLRASRRAVARFTSVDPTNPVHAVALSMSFLVLVNLFITLGLGLRNVAEMLEASQAAGVEMNLTAALWVQNIIFLVMALVGVGWLARRTFKGVLNRLGLVVPTFSQAVVGLVLGLLLVPAIILLELAASQVGFGADPDVERLTEQLIGPLTLSIPGILTLGLAAAIGEESVFRGALQPRFGLVLTTLLFALLHSQYGFSFSTVAVFLVGLVLGFLRLRANTTTAMIAHAVYNMSLGLIAYLGLLENL
ncbi:MAG: lysostaphin resistance A-like protein [Anaerolineae bacterium]